MYYGDSVRVKQGYINERYPDVDFDHWQGRINRFYDCNEQREENEKETWVEIEFDSITLKQMPVEFIERCVKENSDYGIMEFLIEYIEFTNPRDTYQETKDTRLAMNKWYNYESILDEEAAISELIYDWVNHVN
jgi:hypothetical protein